MYVYTAVDIWTYDLLHIVIAPNLGKASARVFLQELWAKGYRPQGIVTDLSADYPEPIAQVFPQATHHVCIFHTADPDVAAVFKSCDCDGTGQPAV